MPKTPDYTLKRKLLNFSKYLEFDLNEICRYIDTQNKYSFNQFIIRFIALKKVKERQCDIQITQVQTHTNSKRHIFRIINTERH